MAKRIGANQAQVLSLLRGSQVSLSAYEVLEQLQRENPKVAPPTVYRALTALIESGDVHKLESKKAFIACQCESHHRPSFMAICDACGSVEECVAPEIVGSLSKRAGEIGFAATHHVIELQGLCVECDSAGEAT